MTGPVISGLTWDHPRGYAPLEELARLGPGDLRWSRQPLEGFESAPIDGLAGEHHILVIDHPGLGAAVESGALVAMDELFGGEELAAWRAGTAGPSFDSYTLDGRTWALPLDAATQVAAARAGQVPEPPATWSEVRDLAREAAVTLCLGGPHALLMFCSLCVAQDAPPGETPGTFARRESGLAALDLMAELLAVADPVTSRLNPIGVLEAMAAPGGPAYCPLVYGYVTYQGPLAFGDAPAWVPGGRRGSVLGGTGLAVSRRRTGDPAVREAVAGHLRRLTGDHAQREVFPATGGQPASLAAWTGAGGFYAATRATLETAWIRLRLPGYVGFQTAASRVLRDGLAARAPHASILDELDHRYRDWRRD